LRLPEKTLKSGKKKVIGVKFPCAVSGKALTSYLMKKKEDEEEKEKQKEERKRRREEGRASGIKNRKSCSKQN
jgi:hypothetical protein